MLEDAGMTVTRASDGKEVVDCILYRTLSGFLHVRYFRLLLPMDMHKDHRKKESQLRHLHRRSNNS